MKDPFYIQWHITNFCNLRCQHCYQDDFSDHQDLDGSDLRKISDNILEALKTWRQTACIHLTGGEPLLKSELFFLLDYLNRQSAVEELGIITNGLPLHPAMIKKLSAFSKLKKMKISLDGADAETHESIRPRFTFDKVMGALSLLKKEKRFEIIVMFTVTKGNYENLPSLLRFCQNLGADGLILERFIPWGRGREIQKEVLDKKEWKSIIRTLMEFISAEVEEDLLLPYQAFQVQFHGQEPELLGAPCVAGTGGFCIMPQGEVFPCRRFPISIGNLLFEPLVQLWERSDLLDKIRKKENLKGKCSCCPMTQCRGCRSLALSLTGDYLAEDPHCSYPN